MAPMLIVMAATAAISAYGALQQSKVQSANAKSAQAAANYNATVDKQNAMSAEAAGSARELAMRRQNDQIMGRERAAVGESGGGFTGTNVGVLAQNGTNLELNALNERYNADMQGRGLLSAANEQEFQANVAGQNASAFKTDGYIGAASAALSGASSYANARYIGGYG